MKILATLYCVRCRGTAYEDDGTLSCLNCGRLLAVIPPPWKFKTAMIDDEHRNRHIRYSPEVKAICVQWLMEGESIADVTYASGVGGKTLSDWRKAERKRLSLSHSDRPRYSAEFREVCVERLRAGFDVMDLARGKGVHVVTLREWRTAAGIDAPCERNRYTEEYKREIVKRLEDGEALNAIANETGITPRSLRRWRDVTLA